VLDLKSIEGVKSYKGIFGKTGERKVTPTELYEFFEVPKELHPTFTIKPLNPINAQELKQINADAREIANEHLTEKGFDIFKISMTIEAVGQFFRDIADKKGTKKERDKTAVELIRGIKEQYNNKNNLKTSIEEFKEKWGKVEVGDNYNHSVLLLVLKKLEKVNQDTHKDFQMSRDLGRVFDIMIAHTVRVENYVVEGADGLDDASGDFTQDTLYSLQDDVRDWLYTEIENESSLTTIEKLGL